VERRPLGTTGIEVSVVGLGCNNFGSSFVGRLDLGRTRAVVDAALDAGVDFLDTADYYGDRGNSEAFLGEVLAGRRDRVVLATKFGEPMTPDAPAARGAPGYIRGAVEASLRRLRTDHIDLYLYHRPDGVTPVADTLGALDELVRAGLVRAVGCSNFTPALLDEAAAVDGVTPFAVLQNEYSLLEREAEAALLPRCAELGMSFVPYFPLASGLLSGKYAAGRPAPAGTRLAEVPRGFDAPRLARVEALRAYAEERDRSLLELAFSYLASEPVVASVIAGATRPEQVRANAAAAGWRLSAAERAEVAALAS
jgi:aryl-alcohol dehydrogenase-like predicted oxidoreductase